MARLVSSVRAFRLKASALETLGGTVGNADALDAHRFGVGFALGRIECGAGRHEARHAVHNPQPPRHG